MKIRNLFSLILLGALFQGCCGGIFNTCEEEEPFESGSRYEPVFMERSEFDTSVALQNSLSIGRSGKIYVKDNLLFINEVNKGFHIYDNSDPASPKAIHFLAAPGSTDLAIRNDMVYINQARDLIAVEYDAVEDAIALTKRIPDTFPEMLSPDGFYAFDTPPNSVIVNWIPKNQ